jgi:hypothetical protein
LVLLAEAHLVENPAYLYRVDSHSRDAQIHREARIERDTVTVQQRIDQRRVHRQEIREANFRSTVPTLPTYQTYDDIPFLALPSEDVMRDRLKMFVDATNNDALKKFPCLSCGGQHFASMCKPGSIALDKIPNSHHLKPDVEHPMHEYTAGMLLERSAVTFNMQGKYEGTICLKCYRSLCNNNRPANALARGLWVGDVPEELKKLTLAERILVQLAFPRVYLVKLQPKKRRATGAPMALPADQLFDGISGSVCSVKMPTDEVVCMLEGKLANAPTLPNPSLILAHTISVAYLGFGKTPPYYLRNLFLVRRQVVLSAIKWLCFNNPVYKNVTIDEEALSALPEDGIPDSIVVRDGASAHDIALAASEGVGYTRQDDEGEEDNGQDHEMHEMRGAGTNEIVDCSKV